MKLFDDSLGSLNHWLCDYWALGFLLPQFPYHLHSVLVHEGQAVSGHYWSFILDTQRGTWLKFNDITVSESTEEEMSKESRGGFHNASAYCLMYVDRSRLQLGKQGKHLSPWTNHRRDFWHFLGKWQFFSFWQFFAISCNFLYFCAIFNCFFPRIFEIDCFFLIYKKKLKKLKIEM